MRLNSYALNTSPAVRDRDLADALAGLYAGPFRRGPLPGRTAGLDRLRGYNPTGWLTDQADPQGPPLVNGVNKRDLPTKPCAACGRPFAWRKKWARDWDRVRYCSDRCRTAGASKAAPG